MDAITTIPNDPNAFDEALFALGREFGTRAEYRCAVEAMVENDPALSVWARVCQILYLLDIFNAEMLNDSVHQFFYNSSGALAPDVADALQAVGRPKHADAVRRGIAMFAAPCPRDTEGCRERYFHGKGWTRFDDGLSDLTGAVDDGAIPDAMLALAKREGVLPP